MREYKTFIFESYEFNKEKREIKLFYSLDNKVFFCEKITLPDIDYFSFNEELLDKALFNLHLIAGASYYKTYCPKEIKISSGVLSKEQALFWNDIYTKGLGEFFFKNNIDFRGLVDFPFEKDVRSSASSVELPSRTLVPLGGGKDSIVSSELIKEEEIDFDFLRLGKSEIVQGIAEKAGKKVLYMERELSSELFRLNKEDVYNGHVPITAYVNFLSVVFCILFGYKYLAHSMEKSADEGNVEYLGEIVNHQYSKSFAFEKSFSKYLNDYISPDIKVFSLLRPLSELKIVQIFSQYKDYFPLFASCNANWTITKKKPEGKWCGFCPKCVFIFLALSAFLPKEEVVKIFGKNLFADEKLQPLFLSLIGKHKFKPFECVGTLEESMAAFILASKSGEYSDDFIMKYFDTNILGSVPNPEELIKEVFKGGSTENIPEEFKSIIKKL